MNQTSRVIALFVLAFTPMLMGAKGGCAKKIEEAKARVPDFSGNYDIAHDDAITVEVVIGGVTETYEGTQGGIIDLGDAQLDLSKACAYENVHCPSEAFWQQVAIDQPLMDLETNDNPWLLRIVNLTTGQDSYAMERGGVVGEKGKYSILLGLGATAVGSCGLLAASVADGTFALDARGEPTGEIVDGRVITAYSGACLLPGLQTGDVLAGATIKLSTRYTGTRTGGWALPSELADTPVLDEDGNEVIE